MRGELRARTVFLVLLPPIFFCSCAFSLTTVHAQADELSVAVSLPDFIPIVSDIGQEHVRITGIMPPGTDPHGFTLTPAKIEEISSADIIVLANSNLLNYERNIRENYPDKVYLDFLDYEKDGASLDDFPDYPRNSHGYWLKADNGIAIAKAFERKLAVRDSQHIEEYERNLNAFISRVEVAKSDLDTLSQIHELRNKKVIAAVPGVNYIIQNTKMRVGRVLLSEGSGFASGQALLEIEQSLINGENLAIVCPESMREAKVGEISRQISQDTGAPVVYVRFLSSQNEESYISQLYYNAAQFLSIGARSEIRSDQSLLFVIAIALISILALAEAYVIFRLRSRSWEMREMIEGPGKADEEQSSEKG
ncbi:MAG: metal ABC transporter substrate-binding protein [Thermoplasmata archaeon]